MNRSPEVSVIIPTYNRAQTVLRSIESVLNQSYSDLEVIVVDDGSADETQKLVTSLSDARISLVMHDQNRGACVARNTGISLAKGRFVAFQDSDDEWHPGKLKKQMALMEAGPSDSRIVYSGFVRRDRELEVYVPGPEVRVRRGWVLDPLLEGNFVSTQTMVVPRQCLEMVGGFTVGLGRFQDWDLAIRLAELYAFDLVDEPLVTVHATADSISSDMPAYMRALGEILDRHHARLGRDPETEARWRVHLAHCLCALGHMGEGRRHFRRALRLGHPAKRPSAALAASFLGKGIYRLLYRRFIGGWLPMP